MSSKIRVLTESTINKIAAGEVIENPASAIKELIENSLDAGASDICVEVSGGGRQLIRVTDNGCGMNCDDALLCLERHATSKIREVEDIQEIGTMGFRGEAIPSIAAISKFNLLTCSKEKPTEATLIIVEGGKIVKCCPAERSPGTTVEVKSLFFNVPVRRKFQKSPQHDTNEILKMLQTLSFGNPNVKFQLISNQETIFSTPTTFQDDFLTCLGERISVALGMTFFEGMKKIDYSSGECHIRGFIGDPWHHRRNRSGQYLFINRRPIFSHPISTLIREGYGTMLAAQTFPIFVLHLDFPGHWIDVNVHPQKREVRIRQETDLKQVIIAAIEKALRSPASNLQPVASLSSQEERSLPWDVPVQMNALKMRPAVPEKNLLEELPLPDKKPLPKVIGTLSNYIITSDEIEGICIWDQQGIHQRIMYEKLMRGQMEETEIQTFLLPMIIELSKYEALLLKAHLNDLRLLGFHIEEFGPCAFAINAIPSHLNPQQIETLLHETLQDLSEFSTSGALKMEKSKQLAKSASRAAMPNSRRLSISEAQALINQLNKCEAPQQSPFGKPNKITLNSNLLGFHFEN